MQCIQACKLTKESFYAGLEHMAARSHGNGTNFDWLRKSCDISTCDLSPNGNLEKYGRPMKSAILEGLNQFNVAPTSPLVQMWIKTHRCLICMKNPNLSMHHILEHINQDIRRR